MGYSKPRPPLPSGPYLVVGLARSGQAAARLLAARGEEVVGVDAGSPPGAARLAEAGVEVNLDGQGIEHLERIRCVVKSPGVPAEAPVVARARERGRTVIGELELAWRLLPNPFVAVIGTNGATPGAAGLAEAGVEVNLDGQGIEHLERIRCVVKSPGVPAEAPVVALARERGRTVIGELELAWRLLPNPFVAVTGTNGKTTATELCAEVWRAAGRPVAVAGNVGTPVASLVGEVSAGATDRL